MLLRYLKTSLPFLALLLSVAIWGGLPTMTKLALASMSVSGFIAVRFLFSSILLAPCFLGIIKKSKQMPLTSWLAFIITISIMFYSQTWAIGQVSVSWYVVIFSITPVIMALCLRYRMQWQAVLGVVVVGMSLFLFLAAGHKMGQWHILAMIAVVIGMLSWVIYSVLMNKFHVVYNDIQITAMTCYIAAVVSLCVWLFQDGHYLFNLSNRAYVISALAGVILPVAFFCYSYAMRYQPRFSIFGQYLEPIFGLIIAAIILGGSLSIKQYATFVFILLGVLVVTHYSTAKEKKVVTT